MYRSKSYISMCGICGVYNYGVKEKPVERSLIQQMMDKMQDRGPDDAGTYFAGSLALEFRRLAIIDILGGHQPLSDESEKFWLVLNGEIYNYPALKQELIAKGHHFKTQTDAEVHVVSSGIIAHAKLYNTKVIASKIELMVQEIVPEYILFITPKEPESIVLKML